jgi:integrase
LSEGRRKQSTPALVVGGLATLIASPHAGAHLRGNCAPIVGDSRAVLGGSAPARGKHSKAKTDVSDGHVPLHSLLAGHLRAWHRQTPHVNETDFVSPSFRAKGRKPLCSSVFVADYLRPAAKRAGVHIEDGQRFGLHNLRHSLTNWLVNTAKVEPKTVQGILRHSKIQATLDLYTQEDRDETRAAQGEFLNTAAMSAVVSLQKSGAV